MKTTFKATWVALALLLALSSCQNLETDVQTPETTSPQKELREVIITASISDAQDETRTSYNETEGKNYWSPGDKIKVFSAGEEAEFTSMNTSPEPIVKFKGYIASITGSSNDDDDSKDYVWGLYPYSTGATYAEPDGISRTAQITTTYPDVQVGVAGTFGDNLAVMIGRSESLSIPFRGAYSGAFFKVSRSDIVSMTLRGLNNEVLVGKATLGLDNNLLPVVEEVTDGKTAVTVTAPNGTFEPDKNYYIITLPDVALPNGYSVTLRRSDGYEGTYELRANRPLNRIRFRNLSEPVDVRIENPGNISDGISTGWVRSTTQGVNEIWYETSDNSVVEYNTERVSMTGNEVDTDNCVAPSDNGGIGIIRFKSALTEVDVEAFLEQQALTSVTLPEAVESIGLQAFRGCSNLATVNLGSNVKRIGESAFWDSGLETIILPEGLEGIGADAFAGCANLTEITIPNSVTDLNFGYGGTNPFYGCVSLTRFNGKFASDDGRFLIDDGEILSFATGGLAGATYVIPNGVTTIGADAFANALISHVVFPSSLRIIGDYAFRGSSLVDLTIPKTVTDVYSYAFYSCRVLQWIKILRTSTVLRTESPGKMFDYSNCPIFVPANMLKYYKNDQFWERYVDRYQPLPEANEIQYTSSDGEAVTYVVPYGSTTVVDTDNCVAPKDNNGIGIIKFTGPLTKVDFQAFATSSDYPDHENLTSITLPGGVEVIERRAFTDCFNLTAVQFGSGIKHIGEDAFSGCGITSLNLPEGLTRLDYGAFAYNSNLSEVTLPESLQQVGYDDDGYFFGNPFENTPSLTSIRGKFASDDGKCLIYNYNGNDYLMSFATGGMTGATYTVPSGVYGIGGLAFGNTTLKKVVLPDGLTLIADFAFMNSGNLESVNIPATVTSIRIRAFGGCSSLLTVHMDGATPPTLGASAFYNTPSDMEIEIPGAGYMAYATGASNSWANLHLQMVAYQTNQEIWYHNDIADVTDNYDGNFGANYSTTMTIPGDVLKGFKMNVDPPSALGDAPSFKIMVFDGPVTSVGDYCFGDDGLYHDPALHVDFVSLPKTAASIGNGAFKGNTKLLKYPVPVGVLTSIGDDAFNGCSSMAGTNINWLGTNSIYTGYSDLELGARAFKGCVGFEKFAGQVTSMGKGAFQGCTNLTKAEVGSMMEIPDSAFYGCNHLEEFVYFRDHLTNIGNHAFRNCYALNLIWNRTSDNQIVGANINASSIGKYAFASCRGIMEVKAPGLVTIDEYGFYDCRSIQSITAPSLENIKMYGLGNCYSLASLELPAIKNISSRALSYPRDLALLRLGPNLQFIGDEVFYTINNQTVNGISVTINENQLELYFEGTDLTSSKPNIQPKAFGYQYQNSGQTATYYIPFKFKKIYVPSSALEDYKSKLKVDIANGQYSYWDAGLVEGI